jgi:hypothetical protein
MKTRNGKIARLPRPVREQLNKRLERSESSSRLLPWLNALPETRELVQKEFAGVPISKQNLSQWRRGGFQESLAWRYIRRQTSDGAAMLLAKSLAGLICPSKQSGMTGVALRNPKKHASACRKDSYGKHAGQAGPSQSP